MYSHLIFLLLLSNLNIFYYQAGSPTPDEPLPMQSKNGDETITYLPDLKLSIDNTNIFNNIIKFNNKNYKAGKFAINNKGELILELSENNEMNSARLFYGLTKEGRFLFSNKSSYTKDININIDNSISTKGKGYPDFDLFISINNNSYLNKQYLFSINSNNLRIGLFDLNDDNNVYYIWNFYNFFGMNGSDYNFEYKYSLFEIKEDSSYLIVFIPMNTIDNNMIEKQFIKKFGFKSFDSNTYEEINALKYNEFLNRRIINVFFMDDFETLVVFVYITGSGIITHSGGANNIRLYRGGYLNTGLNPQNQNGLYVLN